MTFTPGRADPTPCSRDCAEFIVADGEISPDSVADFLALWGRLPRKDLPLILNSPGGRLDGALALGRALRGLDVAVTIARMRPLGPVSQGVTHYAPRRDAGACLSACVYAFAGAARRSLGPGATLGVHQFYLARTDDPARRPRTAYSGAYVGEVQQTVARLAAYLAEMRIDLRLLSLAADTGPGAMRVLTEAEVADLKLATSDGFATPARVADLRPALAAEAEPPATPASGGWPIVIRNGQPWLVLRAETQSRRFGAIANEVAIGCDVVTPGPAFVATFREILPVGHPAPAGTARIVTGSGGGLLPAGDGAGELRGTLAIDTIDAAERTGALDVDVTSAATANYPMRVTFPGAGLGRALEQLSRACVGR